VLGAGNVSSIGPMDALYKLFVEGQVRPQDEPGQRVPGPRSSPRPSSRWWSAAFRIVYGGAAEGEYLCNHPDVDEIHITGSDKTHDAIVFGSARTARAARQAKKPRNTKRVTSELGNVSPIIIVPGPVESVRHRVPGREHRVVAHQQRGLQLQRHARVVTQQGAGRSANAFLERSGRPSRVRAARAVLPGRRRAHDRFLRRTPRRVSSGPWRGQGALDVHPGTSSDDAGDICFNTEAWCGVTSETALEAGPWWSTSSAPWTSPTTRCGARSAAPSSCTPKSLEDPAVANAVEKAIADLRFGSVAVNHWAALSYAFVSTTWGAYPGHTIYDVRSGIGTVHNTYMFEKPEKSVVRGPFKVFPKPAWFNDHKTSHAIGPKLMRLYREPSLDKIPGLLFEAIRG
jgi:hypothetical protein